MAVIVNFFPVVMVTAVLFQEGVSQPLLNRLVEEAEVDMDRGNCVSSREALESLIEDRRGHPRRPPFHSEQADSGDAVNMVARYARQLGDIEFTNRYAEYMRSKAKITTICAYLQRMQATKKSGLGGDAERVNTLMKQYMCPNVYQ